MLSPGKRELVGRVLDAVRNSGGIAVLGNSDHPAEINVLIGERKIRILVYIWRLTSGGPEGVRPSGEYRIQITGVRPPLRNEPGMSTLLLGYEELTGIFAGFNTHRASWGSSPSVQIRWEAIEAALQNGFGFYRKDSDIEGEVPVAFSPENFLSYVERHNEFHSSVEHPEELQVMEAASSGQEIDLNRIIGEGRRSVVRAVSERLGQANFSARVKNVYGNRCAVCGLQLNLTEAAHIIPVADHGSNATNNGICLCHLHHRAYDGALIGIMPNLSIRISEPGIEALMQRGLIHGLEIFRENLLDEMLLPLRPEHRPAPETLASGLQMRGFPT